MLTIRSAFGTPAAWEFWSRMGFEAMEKALATGNAKKIEAALQSQFVGAWSAAASQARTSKAKVAAKKDGSKVCGMTVMGRAGWGVHVRALACICASWGYLCACARVCCACVCVCALLDVHLRAYMCAVMFKAKVAAKKDGSRYVIVLCWARWERRAWVCTFVYVCKCGGTCVCMCAHVCVRVRARARARACACARAGLSSVDACVCACVHVRACQCAFACISVHANVQGEGS
jgi:hypothetical protein